MHELISHLERKQWLWRANQQQQQPDLQPSGYPELDEKLSGGFPRQGLIEIQSSQGIGELRLLQPLLSQSPQQKLSVFIAPPGQICAEFLAGHGLSPGQILLIRPKNEKEALWAAEQCARSGACAHVLLWQEALSVHQARRLQLACEAGQCSQFIFRRPVTDGLPLPVSLSLHLQPHPQGLECTINKRKGGWTPGRFHISFAGHWPALCQAPQTHQVIPFPQRKRG